MSVERSVSGVRLSLLPSFLWLYHYYYLLFLMIIYLKNNAVLLLLRRMLYRRFEILVIIMAIMIIPPLQSPHQGDSNGGQIIKIGFFININRINSAVQTMSHYLYQLRRRYVYNIIFK